MFDFADGRGPVNHAAQGRKKAVDTVLFSVFVR